MGKKGGGGGAPRKTRLDKGASGTASGEFLGFAAFAAPAAAPSPSSSPADAPGAAASSAASPSGAVVGGGPRPSPVYEGSDADLRLLFRRVGQKRDAATKCRALSDLAREAFPPPPSDGSEEEEENGEATERKDLPRSERVAALSHLVYLHTTKLAYDNAPSVRSESIRTLTAARRHVPKAWRSLLSKYDGGVCAGMAFCGCADSAGEAKGSAEEWIKDAEEGGGLSREEIRCGTCAYVKRVLGYGRASGLHDALFGKRSGGGAAAASAKGGEGKKKKKGSGGDAAAAAVAESEREEMEERYERVVVAALGGMGLLVRRYPENNSGGGGDGDGRGDGKEDDTSETTRTYADLLGSDGVALLWKQLTASRTSFRRAAYALLCDAARSAPSLVAHDTSKLGSLLPKVLLQERDPSNFPPFFDALLLYVASFRKAGANPWDAVNGGLDPDVTIDALAKVLRKGCHGSPAVRWAPGMLPLAASLPRDNVGRAAKLIESLWDGRARAVSAADEAAVAGATAECAAFLLLRKENDSSGSNKEDDGKEDEEEDDDNEENAASAAAAAFRKIASFIPLPLAYYLTEPKCVPGTAAARDLSRSLSRDLRRLDSAASSLCDGDDYTLSRDGIGEVLWTEVGKCLQAPSKENYVGGDEEVAEAAAAEDRRTMAERANVLLRGVLELEQGGDKAEGAAGSDSGRDRSRLRPAVRDLVRAVVEPSRRLSSRGALETALSPAEVEFVTTAVDLYGAGYILHVATEDEEKEDDAAAAADSGAVESFCMNDVLRWIVVRTAVSSKKATPMKDVETDFLLLRSCLLSLPSNDQRQRVWGAVLWEALAARADLGALSRGLSILVVGGGGAGGGGEAEAKDAAEWVRCDVLDDFATQAGEVAADHYRATATERWLHPRGDEEEEESGAAAVVAGMESLVRVCAGLGRSGRDESPALVSAGAVRNWVDSACSGAAVPPVVDEVAAGPRNVLLEVLLALASSSSSAKRDLVGRDDAVRLALESWKQGGPSWDGPRGRRSGTGADLVAAKLERQDKDRFLEGASGSLRSYLCGIEDIGDDGAATVPLNQRCEAWSGRAWRLLRIENQVIEATGLIDVQLWEDAEADGGVFADRAYLCLVRLLSELDESSSRRDMLLGERMEEESNDDAFFSAVRLFLQILLSQVHANTPNISPERRLSRCWALLDLLGGKDGLGTPFLFCCARNLTQILAERMKQTAEAEKGREEEKDRISSCVAVLDFLLSTLFGTYTAEESGEIRPPLANGGDGEQENDAVKAADVKEGDSLWYKADGGRVRATVVKVHDDNYPEPPYFTVRLEGGENERQTVAEKLAKREAVDASNGEQEERANFVPESTEPLVALTEEDKQRRQRIEALIVDKLVKPYLLTSLDDTGDDIVSHRLADTAAECASIVVSRCGLAGKAGLGSVRYEVFQLITELDRRLRDALAGRQADLAERLLRRLALVLGVGVHTLSSSSPANGKILRFDPNAAVSEIMDFSDSEQWTNYLSDRQRGLPLAILMFMVVSMPKVSDAFLLQRAMSLLENLFQDTLVSQTTDKKDEDALTGSFLLSLRAFEAAQTAAEKCMNYSSADEDSEKRILSTILGTFSTLPNDQDGHTASNDPINGEAHYDPVWLAPLVSLVRRNSGADHIHHLLDAVATNVDKGLCGTLFSPTKRRAGLFLLSALAKEGKELYPDGSGETDEPMNAATLRRLDGWKEGLDPEEAEELEEDAEAAARWLPHELMNEIEGWIDNRGDTAEFRGSEDVLLGRLLTWLVCLDYLDGASKVDIRNRSHISSYLDKTEGLGEVLTTSLDYARFGDKRIDEWISCTGIEEDEDGTSTMQLSSVATLVVFRTIESLPTLAKSWWTDDCPRPMRDPVMQFVQNLVAPETLRRELARISGAETLGELNVNGSCVSREVVATYQQDECQLSVLVRIPAVFPLRNVEVDCQKTLGVAEKRYRRWALQIMKMLNTQDGSVLDALLLWKENVDKEFEGVEPCPVCYSVLCVKTHAMPNLECKTCQNRFHSSCLFQWFKSSGKSQCVLCQQPWSGTKV